MYGEDGGGFVERAHQGADTASTIEQGADDVPPDETVCASDRHDVRFGHGTSWRRGAACRGRP